MLEHGSFAIEETIRQAVAAGAATSVALSISRSSGPIKEWYSGTHLPNMGGLPCSAQSFFDLASLTKPLSTTLWFLRAVHTGLINFDDPLEKYLSLDDPTLRRTPVWRLLTHTTGLPAHKRYYEGYGARIMTAKRRMETKRSVRRSLKSERIAPTMQNSEKYSDLGYLVIEEVTQNAVGQPLEIGWHTLPNHSQESLHFSPIPLNIAPDKYVATEWCPWRKTLLQGEVHDDNAWVMGGICGHAGLFGTLNNVHEHGRQWLRAIRGEPNNLGIGQDTLTMALSRSNMARSGTRVMGWDTPTPGASSSGKYFGPKSIGHLGFTGTSIWMDPVQDVLIVLLTNRVCPNRDDIRIRRLRPKLHDLAWTWLEGES